MKQVQTKRNSDYTDKVKKILKLIKKNKIGSMTLQQIADKVGYGSPQAVKYILDKYNKGKLK